MPVGTAATVKARLRRSAEGGRRRHHPRQHLSPDAAAGRRAHRQARRPARVHALGPADPHRLRRLPGDEPRPSCARSPTRASPSSRTSTARAHMLTPERAVEIQCLLGSDIQMQLDECVALPASRRGNRSRHAALAGLGRALPRARSRSSGSEGRRGPGQALFGIVQGGIDAELRQRSAEALVAMDLPGYAVGGLAVGEPQEAMLATLETTTPRLPADKPRYLMGVGTPHRPDRERGARHRHVRLRDADPLGPARPGLHLGRQGQPAQRPLRRRSRARSMRRAAARRRATTAAPTCITSSSPRSISAPCCCPGPTSPSTRS